MISDPVTERPASTEGWLDKESFGFGLVGGTLVSGLLSLIAETLFHVTAIARAAAMVVIAMGLTVWFWRKRPRRH